MTYYICYLKTVADGITIYVNVIYGNVIYVLLTGYTSEAAANHHQARSRKNAG